MADRQVALGVIVAKRFERESKDELVGDTERGSSRGGVFAGLRRRWEARALQELATDTDTQPSGTPIVFVSAVLFGNLRLLVGMVRANRPWRLATTLYRHLAAALAAGAFGVVSPDIWHVSAALEWWRLVAVSLLSITITVVSVIAAHRLWEHAPDPRVREQVVLFNVATAGTVTRHPHALRFTLRADPAGGRPRDRTGRVSHERLGMTSASATT